MTDSTSRLPLWPFILADVVFLAFAALLLRFGHHPLTWQESALMTLCGGLGSLSFLAPFWRRNADAAALSQARLLAEAAGQIQKLDQLGGLIISATHRWRELQTDTCKAAESAKQCAERISAEAQAFEEFMVKANDSERAHLRLEVEKLRRGDGERLQVLIHVLDHVFALFQAAKRSGQPALAEQIGHFQNACREAARRIGLVQIAVPPGEAFDGKLHQLPENISAENGAAVEDTLVAGYTFQGQVLRRPVVSLKAAKE